MKIKIVKLPISSFRARILRFIIIIIIISEGEKPENKQKRLEQKYASLQIVPNIERLGSAKVQTQREKQSC